jgi:hypothetical protein
LNFTDFQVSIKMLVLVVTVSEFYEVYKNLCRRSITGLRLAISIKRCCWCCVTNTYFHYFSTDYSKKNTREQRVYKCDYWTSVCWGETQMKHFGKQELIYGIWYSYISGYEEFCLLGYKGCSPLKVNGHFGGTNHLHCQDRCYMLHAGFLLGLFFDSEDRSEVFFQNVGCCSTDYTALYPR